jgi:ABC-type transporter MlaC component
VTARSVTRAALLAGLFGLGALAISPDAYAARNADAEHYVQQHATGALAVLGNLDVSAAQRRQQFETLMARFADMPRIAVFVLGRYGGALRSDAALQREWQTVFQEYAIASYEDQFRDFGGGNINVTGSEERVPGSDVVVVSTIRPRGGQAQTVQWRVLRSGNGWKVVDVAAGQDQVWLAQLQQRQFLSILNANRGDIRALISDVRTQTASIRERVSRG